MSQSESGIHLKSAKPQRIRLSRKAGFNLQAESKKLNGLSAVNCARPSKWGNKFIVAKNSKEIRRKMYVENFGLAVLLHQYEIERDQIKQETIRKELRGKNLACWCPIGQPCHCDILLKIANE